MQGQAQRRVPTHEWRVRRVRSLCSMLLAALAACGPEAPSAPSKPEAESHASLSARAFTVDFDLVAGRVLVSGPVIAPFAGSPSVSRATMSFVAQNSAAAHSLLGTGFVELQLSNFSAGAIGASVPGKVLIRTDLRIMNLLNASLVTPTFPVPPVGVSGVQVFPFEIFATDQPGGALVRSPPGSGPVQPSNDWSGDPHNFLNDVACFAPASDCFRYEPFPVVMPFGVSPMGSIGFLVEPTVRQFRASFLLAADLLSASASGLRQVP